MISLALVIDGLFKMVFACLWMVLADFEVVVEFFEVVLGFLRFPESFAEDTLSMVILPDLR